MAPVSYGMCAHVPSAMWAITAARRRLARAEVWRREMECVGMLPGDFPAIEIGPGAQPGVVNVNFISGAGHTVGADQAQALLDEWNMPDVQKASR